MMDKVQSITRLKRILHNDKSNLPERFNEVLASELYGMLFSYFDLLREDIEVALELGTDGEYQLVIKAKAKSVKTFFQI